MGTDANVTLRPNPPSPPFDKGGFSCFRPLKNGAFGCLPPLKKAGLGCLPLLKKAGFGCFPPLKKGGQGGFILNWQKSASYPKRGKAGVGAIVATLVLLTTAPAWALDGDAILQKVDRNLNPESYEMYRKLINIEPDGRKKEFVLYTVKKGRDKMVALFLDPPSEKGRATLRLDDNLWLYIPGVGKPLRITSLQSVVGGVFNNADILNLDYGVEYAVQNSEPRANAYLLDLKARTATVAYDLLKMRVDAATLLPTEIEAYAASGLLIKTLRFKDLKDFGNGVRRPAVLETDSPLYKGYKSVMLYSRIRAREFKDEVFTLNYLPRAGELR